MHPTLLFLIIIAIPSVLKGQTLQEIVVEKGEVTTEVIPAEEQYLFPEFRQGKAVFFNNREMPALLNYSHLYGEIHFLGKNGDTLSIENGHQLQYLSIGKRIFYFAHWNGFIEVVKEFPAIKLSKYEVYKVVKSYPRLYVGEPGKVQLNFKELYTQKSPGKMFIEKQPSYFFIDKNKRFYPAKRSKILKIFPRNKRAIKKYLKEKNIDFHEEEDLIKLLAFCSRLAEGK